MQRAPVEQEESKSKIVVEEPECEFLAQDLFNTNCLLHDIYAPAFTTRGNPVKEP